jgi:hypothetical protein
VDEENAGGKGMSKELGAWKLTILDVKVCKPRKTIKVIASHPLLDTYAVKFDCKYFYEFTYDEKENKYLVEPNGRKFCTPFSPEKFHEYFDEVTTKKKARAIQKVIDQKLKECNEMDRA